MELMRPLQIGDLTLPNRVIMAPLTRCRAIDRRIPNPLMAEYYRQRPLGSELQQQFEDAASRSIERQQQVEEADDLSFEQYLDNFFSQYREL